MTPILALKFWLSCADSCDRDDDVNYGEGVK
jgi:hypothetical protein